MTELTARIACDHCGRCESFVVMEQGLDRLTYTTREINASLQANGWRIIQHTQFRAEHICRGCDQEERTKRLTGVSRR